MVKQAKVPKNKKKKKTNEKAAVDGRRLRSYAFIFRQLNGLLINPSLRPVRRTS